MRWLPSLGSTLARTSIAATDPTGAPSSARPSAPSVSPSRSLTCGMWAVQDANSRPWLTNAATVAARCARLVASPVRLAVRAAAGLDTPDLKASSTQRVDGVRRRVCVGDDNVSLGSVAHYGQGRLPELRAVRRDDHPGRRPQHRPLDLGVAE